jgi:hypothetical protein
MSDALEQLVDSLLYEGYALYPYTPGAIKNATPTPFGIVYPPEYAAALASTFDHLEMRCVVVAAADAVLRAELHCLVSGGAAHGAVPQRVELSGAMIGTLAELPAEKAARLSGPGGEPIEVWIHVSAEPLDAGRYGVSLRVENRTPVRAGLDRREALARSLLSAHPLLRISGGRFVSPLADGFPSINTFPVLATADDTAMLGAAIVLPDHPQIAPESRGSLFDGTEIEEALLLHVQALSDAERAEIEAHDPVVRDMVARAAEATPGEIVNLHGRVTLRDPETTEPPSEPAGLADPRAGEERAEAEGQSFRRGGKVRIHPPSDADLQARMLDGRTATVERIFTDYDGRVHFGLTVDDDPGQDLMRETGRLLFFFASELEVIE